MTTSATQEVHFTELPPAHPMDPIAADWEVYRREVGRLLREGHAGKFALIFGAKLVGVYDELDGRHIGAILSASGPFLLQPILERQPPVKRAYGTRICLFEYPSRLPANG